MPEFSGFHIEHILALFVLVIVVVALLKQMSHRQRQSDKKRRQLETNQQAAAQNAERQQKTQVPSSQNRMLPENPSDTSFAGNIQGTAARWEAELQQIGCKTIGQIDSKIVALQAVTLHANRTANCLEILVEHLEQISRQQIERQQRQMPQDVQAGPSEHAPAVIAESALESVPLDEVLQELADDLECLHRAIKRSTTFDLELEDIPEQSSNRSTTSGGPPAPADTSQQSKRQRGTPEISFHEICREAEMLLEFGLEMPEIAKHLGVPLDTLEFLLQINVVVSDS